MLVDFGDIKKRINIPIVAEETGKNFGRTVFFFEIKSRLCCDGIDQLINEGFTLFINYLEIRMIFFQVIYNSKKQVGFSKTGIAVDKQGVKGFARVVRNRFCRRINELATRARNERIKGKIFIDNFGGINK